MIIRKRTWSRLAFIVAATLPLLAHPRETRAAPGQVLSEVRISEGSGGFPSSLADGDLFGNAVTSIGDLNGDSVDDLAVGAFGYDNLGSDTGAVWILFMTSAGQVDTAHRIDASEPALAGALDAGDMFGSSLVSLGDMDGNGSVELAVGSYLDDDGDALDQGAVYILSLLSTGAVSNYQKISEGSGGFFGVLDAEDRFARTMGPLGDLDEDGTPDLVVGAFGDDDGAANSGAVWILFLNQDATVRSTQKISLLSGNLGTGIGAGDIFGTGVSGLGDLNLDGTIDLAVGAQSDDDGGTDRGAVWILFLNPDGSVKSKQKISDTQGDFAGVLDNSDSFGGHIAWLGHVVNGLPGALAVSAARDDDGGMDRGAVWVLFLNLNGKVSSYQKISSTTGNLTGPLANQDLFGSACAALRDFDGDGRNDIAIGAYQTDSGGIDRGGVYVLFLDGDAIAGLPRDPWGVPLEVQAIFPARPGEVAIGTDREIYVGNYYFPGQDGDSAPIFHAGPSAAQVFPCGSEIPDPDILIIDKLGSITAPGNILVGSMGKISSVTPDCQTVTTVVQNHLLLGNIHDMDFDPAGRLVFSNFIDSAMVMQSNNIVAYDGTSFVEIIPNLGQPPMFAILGSNVYVTVSGTGIVRQYDLTGSLLDGTFLQGTVVGKSNHIGLRQGLFIQRSDSLLHVVVPSREETVLVTGLNDFFRGVDVDSAGDLVLVQFNARRLLRMSLVDITSAQMPARTEHMPFVVSAMPNPFGTGTIVSFRLARRQPTKVMIYGPSGRLVRRLWEQPLDLGEHRFAWDGRDQGGRKLPSGVYFVEVKTSDSRHTTSIRLVK